MQLDLSVLQNIHSDVSPAGVGSTPGNHAAGQKQNPLNSAANEDDFRSALERADGNREAVSQEKNKGDASSAQTIARSQDRGDGKNVHQTKNEAASVDGRTPRVQEAGNEKILGEGDGIPLVPNQNDAVAAAIDFGVAAKVIESDLPIEEPSEISPTAERKDGAMEPLVVAAKPEAPVSGAVTSGPVESMVFDGENLRSAAAPIGLIKEELEGMDSANTSKPSQTSSDLTPGIQASGADSDHPENELPNKPPSEGQKIPPKVDNFSAAAENAQKITAGKTLVQEQTGSEPQSPENVKNAGKIPPTPEGAMVVDEGPHRKAVMSEFMGRAETDRIARLVVDNEHSSRPQGNAAAQNDTPGNQDASSASAAKTGSDFDQSAKVNDLVSSSQRPVVGDGNTPVSAENFDSRPSAPKAEVLNQIVDRAVFKLRNGQSEVRIVLKPDFLGPVRLQIVTESHQVSLRILTESPAVKEIIEGSLGQLKNELQTQGLKVDDIDVSVAKDFNGYDRRSNTAAQGEHGRRGFAFKDRNFPENERPDNRRIPARLDSRAGGVDYFA